MTQSKEISRKDFMKKMGTSIAGVAVVGGVSGLLTGCTSSASGDIKAPEHPFKYVAIDVEKAKERSYDAYFNQGGWGVGVAEGLFGELADDVGYPYNQFPSDAFAHAGSGYGQGSLCGALGVAATFIGTVTDVDTSKAVVRDLFNWYKVAELPIYQPEGLDLKHTVAGTTLCEESCEIYKDAEGGIEHGDHKRKARCAGVTADVVAKTIELLNETV